MIVELDMAGVLLVEILPEGDTERRIRDRLDSGHLTSVLERTFGTLVT